MIDKLVNLLVSIPHDKLLHTFVSLCLCKILYLCSEIIGVNISKYIISFIVLFIGVVIKEIIYDKVLQKGEFDIKDIVANIVGIIIFII